MTKLTARRIANAAARRDADRSKRANVIMASVFKAVEEAVAIDDKGREVRQSRATYDEVAHFLLGNRVVDSVDILRELGQLAYDALLSNGYLKKDPSFNAKRKSNLFWVTAKAQGHYKLPARIRLADDCTVAYA